MKNKINPSDLIEKFIHYATIEGETKLNGDYKKGNAMVKKLRKIFEVIDKDEELAKKVLSDILESDSVRARGLAAAHALRLNIFENEAVKVLEEISRREDIWGFGATMTLKIRRGEFPEKTL